MKFKIKVLEIPIRHNDALYKENEEIVMEKEFAKKLIEGGYAVLVEKIEETIENTKEVIEKIEETIENTEEVIEKTEESTEKPSRKTNKKK